MSDLRAALNTCLSGSAGFLGLGNVLFGDDGVGVRLAERLQQAGVPGVVVAGASPELHIGGASRGLDNLIFLDAVEFGGAPGSVVLLGANEMKARFPQISTHKLSLGILAEWAESEGGPRTWLLGVQPESLRPSESLTPVVLKTLDALSALLLDLRSTARRGAEMVNAS